MQHLSQQAVCDSPPGPSHGYFHKILVISSPVEIEIDNHFLTQKNLPLSITPKHRNRGSQTNNSYTTGVFPSGSLAPGSGLNSGGRAGLSDSQTRTGKKTVAWKSRPVGSAKETLNLSVRFETLVDDRVSFATSPQEPNHRRCHSCFARCSTRHSSEMEMKRSTTSKGATNVYRDQPLNHRRRQNTEILILVPRIEK